MQRPVSSRLPIPFEDALAAFQCESPHISDVCYNIVKEQRMNYLQKTLTILKRTT